MPCFTLEKDKHPFLDVAAYRLEVLMPFDATGGPDSITGYVSDELDVPIVSRQIAELFGANHQNGYATLEIIVQSRFEGDLNYHRTSPIEVEFKIASPRAGEAYFHVPAKVLAEVCDVELFESVHGRELSFVVLRFDETTRPCVVVPMER